MLNKLFYSLLSVVFVSSFQIIALILTSQKATPEQLGVLTMLITVNAFLFLFVDFGLSNFLLHKKNLSQESVKKLKTINITISLAVFLISIIAAIVAYFIGESEEIVHAVWGTGLNSIALALTRIERAKLQSEHRFKDILYLDSISRITGIIALYVLLIFEVNVVYSYLVVLLCINFFAKYLITLLLKENGLNYGTETNSGIKTFCVPQAANSILNFLTQNLDIILIAYFAGLELSGVYGVIKILSTKPLQVFMPVLLRVYTPKIIDMKFYSSTYLQLILVVSVTSSIIYTGLILSGEYLLSRLFNINSAEAVFAFSIFCLYVYLRSICMPVGVLITKTGETKLAFYYTVFQLISVSIMLSFVETSIITIALSFLVYQGVLLIPHWLFLISRLSKVNFLKYHALALSPILIPFLTLNIG